MTTNTRELDCAHVSSSDDGIGFQVLFHKTQDSDEGYLLLQRHFEPPDSGECYVETDDLDSCGHFHIRSAQLSRNWFRIGYGDAPMMQIKVSFKATDSDFDEVKRVLQIMISNLERVQ